MNANTSIMPPHGIELVRDNVFSKPGRWFKGALHLHTRNSDGKMSPDEALRWHKQNGYDFICFGDHWKVTTPVDPEKKVLVIPGCEIDSWHDDAVGNTHVMCVGVDGHADDFRPTERMGLQELWSHAQSISEYCWIAHPFWSTQSAESLKSYPGLRAVEVYNGLFDSTLAMGDGEYPWHMLLNEGMRIDALAVDDAHGREESVGNGWIMVKAAECTRQTIISALKQGDFYATRGPVIHDVRFEENRIVATTSPARRLIVRSSQFFGKCITAPAGRSFTSIEAEINLRDMDHARLVVEDHNGLKAWSNPFYFANSTIRPKSRLEPASPLPGASRSWNPEREVK